jgi:hypothetical protein
MRAYRKAPGVGYGGPKRLAQSHQQGLGNTSDGPVVAEPGPAAGGGYVPDSGRPPQERSGCPVAVAGEGEEPIAPAAQKIDLGYLAGRLPPTAQREIISVPLVPHAGEHIPSFAGMMRHLPDFAHVQFLGAEMVGGMSPN